MPETDRQGRPVRVASAAPPPGLLGVCLLLWGYLAQDSSHLRLGFLAIALGVLGALVVEGHRLTHWRADLSDDDYVRVWNVCVALFLLVGVFRIVSLEIWRWDITRHFQLWLPFLLLPMAFVQLYNRGERVPLVTFSIIARRKRALDVRAGREVPPPQRVHLGYLYFGVLLLSLGSLLRNSGYNRVPHPYLFIAALLGWALWPVWPRGRRRLAILAFFAAIGVGLGVQAIHREVQGVVDRKVVELFGPRGKGDKGSRSRLGDVGDLKLSEEIVWRVQSVDAPPKLLRESAFVIYRDGLWTVPNSGEQLEVNKLEGDTWQVFTPKPGVEQKALRIRGRVRDEAEPLPVPQNTNLLQDLPGSSLKHGRYGLLLLEADQAALDFQAIHSDSAGIDGKYFEQPGGGALDLGVPAGNGQSKPFDQLTPSAQDDALIDQVAKSIAEPGLPAEEAIHGVKTFFSQGGFAYSLEKPAERVPRSRLISHFLTTGKKGHCEYFASATVLLLRKLGVPARYAVGYAVQEFDSAKREYILRGLHRHAWALAWNGQRWVDVDTTPASWTSLHAVRKSWWRSFRDRWNGWMLDWGLWRHSEDKGLAWKVLPLVFAAALFTTVTLRLIRGLRRNRLARRSLSSLSFGETIPIAGTDSEWYDLENALAKMGFPRKEGQTAQSWSRAVAPRLPEAPDLQDALALHYRYRFDPRGLTDEERERLRETASRLTLTLKKDPESLAGTDVTRRG